MDIKAISLSELNENLKLSIKAAFPHNIWVVAEIGEIKENNNGHCYLDLIEKEQNATHIKAKVKATIWSFTYRMLKPYFKSLTGQSLKEGMKIMINASIEYHELYGLSLNVKDIDPNYTIGDLERQRNEIIRKLTEEGVFDMNKEIPLPLVIQRIAVISSETAAGYGDFINHLENNPYGYKIKCKLFSAHMQGEHTETSIIDAFERIHAELSNFDIVTIIRGGGAQSDLSYFDNYWLAYHCAQFPIPVFTGIGHEQDDSIVDMVAHTRLKTPTAVADFIINRMLSFESQIDALAHNLTSLTNNILKDENHQLAMMVLRIPTLVNETLNKKYKEIQKYTFNFRSNIQKSIFNNIQSVDAFKHNLQYKSNHKINRNSHDVHLYVNSLDNKSKRMFQNQINKLTLYENIIQLSNPEHILNKGYSITIWNYVPIKDIKNVSHGDIIETRLVKGRLLSKIIDKKT